jgi:hypothetical protein
MALAVGFWIAAGSIAGIVAALAAVLTLIHQVGRPRDDRPPPRVDYSEPVEPQLELKLSWMFPTYGGTLGPEGIGLTLINRLSHPIHWTSASIDLQDNSGRHVPLMNSAPPGMNLPKWVQPHSSDFTLIAAQQLRDVGFDLARPITARANTATGDVVVSDEWTAGH